MWPLNRTPMHAVISFKVSMLALAPMITPSKSSLGYFCTFRKELSSIFKTIIVVGHI